MVFREIPTSYRVANSRLQSPLFTCYTHWHFFLSLLCPPTWPPHCCCSRGWSGLPPPTARRNYPKEEPSIAEFVTAFLYLNEKLVLEKQQFKSFRKRGNDRGKTKETHKE